MMNRLGNSDVDTVKAIAAYKRDVKDRRIKLEADKKAATKLVAARAADKNRILGYEAQLQTMTKGLKKQIKRLRWATLSRCSLRVICCSPASFWRAPFRCCSRPRQAPPPSPPRRLV